jgi:hypothetical protein
MKLSIKQVNEINQFITSHEPVRLPMVDMRSIKTIKGHFAKVNSNEHDFIIYGQEGAIRSNAFYKNEDNQIFIITVGINDEIISYSFYEPGYEEI